MCLASRQPSDGNFATSGRPADPDRVVRGAWPTGSLNSHHNTGCSGQFRARPASSRHCNAVLTRHSREALENTALPEFACPRQAVVRRLARMDSDRRLGLGRCRMALLNSHGSATAMCRTGITPPHADSRGKRSNCRFYDSPSDSGIIEVAAHLQTAIFPPACSLTLTCQGDTELFIAGDKQLVRPRLFETNGRRVLKPVRATLNR